MISGCTPAQLAAVVEQIDGLLCGCQLLQAKRRERGAWARPGLAGSAADLEKTLLASYRRLEKEVMASLAGRADDLSTARLAQAAKKEVTDAEEEAALAYYGLPDTERERASDPTRLAAILALILLWRRRHLGIARAKAEELFGIGRKNALTEAGQTTLAEGAVAKRLKAGLLDRFTADVDRLERGLQNGTARGEGIETLVKDSLTVGQAAALLRRLFDGEEYRIGMFAEALTWRGWLDGYRSGAIEWTRAKLQKNGVHLSDDLDPKSLIEVELEGVSRYEWAGPLDDKICPPCAAMFTGPVIALSEETLPDPISICDFGLGCRHWWEKVS